MKKGDLVKHTQNNLGVGLVLEKHRVMGSVRVLWLKTLNIYWTSSYKVEAVKKCP